MNNQSAQTTPETLKADAALIDGWEAKAAAYDKLGPDKDGGDPTGDKAKTLRDCARELRSRIELGMEPQPPAGASVSERARNILADAWVSDTRDAKTADNIRTGPLTHTERIAVAAIERALSSPRQEGEVLARGWFHALPECDDYEFHDDASGAGKNCDGCIRAMIVAEGSTAASRQGAWQQLETWLGTFADSIPTEAYSRLVAIQRALLTSPTTGADGETP